MIAQVIYKSRIDRKMPRFPQLLFTREIMLWLVCALWAQLVRREGVTAHGWLEAPPGRSSAWRYGYPTTPNYNDNELNCGGFDNQHVRDAGKCGVCGDPFSGARLHEPGKDNVYASGTIVAKYNQGDIIRIKLRITAPHKGFHEFRLCKNDVSQSGSMAEVATKEECFVLLQSPNGTSKFEELDSNIQLKLPNSVTCTACVLQWRWKTGNRWDCDKEGCGLGFGKQEEFMGCADIEIRGIPVPLIPTESAFTVRASVKDTASTLPPTHPRIGISGVPTTLRLPMTSMLTSKPTPRETTKASELNPVGTSSTKSNHESQNAITTQRNIPKAICRGVAPYGSILDGWCETNCHGISTNCPATHCLCV